ncbi:MAG: DNA methyltransferase, partial [Myxococcales bacterium]|nr:DNA methyltransferase [Myxococcales bacterium]
DSKHPCPKPLQLWIWLIERLTFERGAIVLDPFCGSGTTIIACETTGRIGRGVELSPVYSDVIVTRWQNATGREAVLDGDGRTFAEVSAERLGVND